MAEKEVDATGGVAANRPTGPEAVALDSAMVDELIANSPEPDTSGGKIYKTLYPNDLFVMEGHPVVNTDGVRLSDAQAAEIIPMAEASGVKIVEVSE